MYVPPWMTVEEKKKESYEWKEVKISMHEIFRNKERPAKNIYVIGEAGSGKTMFCKMLVHYWCVAHLYQEYSLDVYDTVKEMKSFKFLFYVSLRHFSDCDSIENMLKKSYSDPALRDILQNDSANCLVLLDGLDEWNPEKKHCSQFLIPGVPGRDLDADYTVITTSRQWKFDSLPISDSEVDKKIKLNGIDRYEMRNLTRKTVATLNFIYRKCKNAEKCIIDLRSRQVSDISHTPLVLQQLIYLWFDDKLRENSMCAIHKSMLDIFLEWKTLGTSESQEQLYVIKAMSRKTRLTYYLSYLAYETLFDKNKETTLTFSSLTLERLSIPHDVISDCLASGILKEDRNMCLSESMESSISFFHNSLQEYLAAVYIASQFKEMLKSHKDEYGLTEVCKNCVGKYFGSCKTVVDILEQSNVLIMLCRLEPQLLTNVSKYIYDLTLVDKMVVEERNNVPEPNRSINYESIQTCILKSIKEVVSIENENHSSVYIAHLYVNYSTDLLRYGRNIILKNVLSIEVVESSYYMEERYRETFYLAVKHLTKCDQLKVMKFKAYYHYRDNRIKNEITTILETNVCTLESVSLLKIDKRNIKRFVSILPKMRRLTSLHISSNDAIAHDICLSLGTFLNQTTSLKHITLGISCEEYDKHMIDLSKHKQLQHFDSTLSIFYMVSCNTDNLETCKLRISSGTMMNQVCNSLYKAGKLKHLHLYSRKLIRYSDIECRTITENLIRLLPSLISLSALTLVGITLTDNVIVRPCYMKNMKEITLDWVTMSMTTWRKFIDSLPALPQVVKVTTSAMFIKDEELFRYIIVHARKYVSEKRNLFRVTYDDTNLCEFTTKKV